MIFDLDDTLLDTSKYLIGPALKSSFEVFKDSDFLNTTFEDFLYSYEQHKRHSPREDFFLTQTSCDITAEKARNSFYSYRIPERIELIDGAWDMLDRIKEHYSIFLVTTGRPKRQKEKIQKTQLDQFFSKWEVVDGVRWQRKGEVFQNIIKENNFLPEEVLCVGNRLDHEIAEAGQLDIPTCLLQYGEYEFLEPINDKEIPSFKIRHLSEILKICRL